MGSVVRPQYPEELVRQLELSSAEAELYMQAIDEAKIDEGVILDPEKKTLVDSLLSKGMLIRGAGKREFVPVHPRLAVSNLFRIYEERAITERKRRRLSADRLTLELIPIYEKSKDTNSPSPEVRKDERA